MIPIKSDELRKRIHDSGKTYEQIQKVMGRGTNYLPETLRRGTMQQTDIDKLAGIGIYVPKDETESAMLAEKPIAKKAAKSKKQPAPDKTGEQAVASKEDDAEKVTPCLACTILKEDLAELICSAVYDATCRAICNVMKDELPGVLHKVWCSLDMENRIPIKRGLFR